MSTDKERATRLADAQASAVPLHDELHWMGRLYGFPIMCRGAERIAALEAALGKIDAIRNSIIGAQKVNWSEHVYPLVAALEEAGYHGQEYEVARENVGTMVERITTLEAVIEQARVAIEWARTIIGHPDDALTADVLGGALRKIEEVQR